MTGSHSRLVAVQTVVVAVLLVVVFVTLLQPASDNSISSIESSGGPSRSQLPGPDIYTSAEGHGGNNGQPGGGQPGGGPQNGSGPGGGSQGTATPSGTEGLALTGPSADVAPEVTPETGPNESTPSGDQYADMLSRLTDRLE